MSKINTIKSRVFLTDSFEKSITEDSNTYIGIGRVRNWETVDGVDSVEESTESIYGIYNNLVAIKKISAADCNPVIPREDWSSGTVYAEYTETLDSYTYLEKTSAGIASGDLNGIEITSDGADLSQIFTVGDTILVQISSTFSFTREIIGISPDNQRVIIDLPLNQTFINTPIFRIANLYPRFANKFYIRNDNDQVFKCLFNNNGAPSTSMPKIDIDGQLPENPFILSADGYKWKYLYTVPNGLKERFFNKQWMPVAEDPLIAGTAVDGRIDVAKVISGGTGYLGGTSNPSANILSVVGNGTGAVLTAKVVGGVITDINIINGGSGYDYAKIVINDPTKLIDGTPANIKPIISPPGGHGSNVFQELGATHLMITCELTESEQNTIPISTETESFKFRQLSLIRDPKNTSGDKLIAQNVLVANKLNLSTTTTFSLGETIYQGQNLENSTFSASVVNWDSINKQVWLNNIKGTLTPFGTISSTSQPIQSTALEYTESGYEMYSGDILFVENRKQITRNDQQSEVVKIIFSF